MGRQSSRIYFQGKDHRDIYFNGHYHDQMYLTDSEGNATLVWEKIKGIPVKGFVSMISHVDGKYYAIVENPAYAASMLFYSSPLLYEGSSLNAMKKAGYIWGDRQVRGESYIMHSAPGKLAVMRTYGTSDPGERYIAVIPLKDGRADLDSVSYATGEKEYYYPNFKAYVYGNGVNYYNPGGGLWDPAIWKNGNKIPYSGRVGGTDGILPCGGRIVGLPRQVAVDDTDALVSGRINADGVHAHMVFFELDDDNDNISPHEVDISACAAHAVGAAAEEIGRSYNTDNGWFRFRGVSVTAEKAHNGGRYAGFMMLDRSVGDIIITMSVEIKFNTGFSDGTYRDRECFRVRIDFRELSMEEYSVEETSVGYMLCSQVLDDTYRVQVLKKDMDGTGCISYGRTGQDCRNDVLLDGLNTGVSPERLASAELTCMAHGGGRIIAGISHADIAAGRFIIIDTVNNTAKTWEINIREV